MFFIELAEASQELSEFESESFFSNDFSYVVEDIASNKNVRNTDEFVDEVLDYMNNPDDELVSFTHLVYNSIVNFDLISKEKERMVDLRDADSGSKSIFLDTNVLVSLFCETDSTHPIVATACERATELGYDLYYITQTIEEMQILIKGTVEELTELDPSRDMDGLTDSQFAEYYLRDYNSPSEFAGDLEEWQSKLETKFNIKHFENEVEVSGEIAGFTKRTLSQFSRETQGHDPERKINHDTALVSIPATLREESESELTTGPFVLSRDTEVTRISNIGEGTYWGRAIALQPRSWLNYLMAFSPANIRGEFDDVAIALLRGAAGTDYEKITLDKYAGLLATKTGVDQEILAQYLNEHPVSDDLYEALNAGDGQKAETLVIEAFEGDYPNRFNVEEELKEEKEEIQERFDEVIDRLKDMSDELEKEKEEKRELKKAFEGGFDIDIDVNSSPTNNVASRSEATAITISEQELQKEIEGLIDLLKSSVSGDLDDTDAPEVPNNTSDWSEVTNWLHDLDIWLSTTDKLASGSDFIQNRIPDLIDKIEYV